MKIGHEDFTTEAWNRGEVGIWYGAWGAADWKKATKQGDPGAYLSKVNRQRGCEWYLENAYIQTAKRFFRIRPEDWIVVYQDNVLSLGRPGSDVYSERNHPLNRGRELFKYRKIISKKSFRLDLLPDAFRLLPSAGRANVFQFRTSLALVELLAQASNEKDVRNALKKLDLDKLLDCLGPTSWESVCHSYLSFEHDFVPTGLRCGGTLACLDIVGRQARDGLRIIAQCKKDPNEVAIDPTFITAAAGKHCLAFYFAYGGCSDQHNRVQVIDHTTIRKWAKTSNGKRYFQWLRGE